MSDDCERVQRIARSLDEEDEGHRDEALEARVRELQDVIEKALPKALGGPPAGRPVVRLVRSSKTFTAQYVEFDGIEGSYLISADEAFFGFLDLMARVFASSLPYDFHRRPVTADELRDHVMERVFETPKRTLFPFAEAAGYLAAEGHVKRVVPPTVDAEQTALRASLHIGAGLFALGHEYAHFELGHGGPPRPALDRLGAAHASTHPEADTTPRKEFMADELGLSISAWAAEGQIATEQLSLGAWIVFTGMQAVRLATCVLAEGSRADGARRYEELERRVEADRYPALSTRKRELYRVLVGMGHCREDVLGPLWGGCEYVWDQMRPYVAHYAELLAHNERRSPAEVWATAG